MRTCHNRKQTTAAKHTTKKVSTKNIFYRSFATCHAKILLQLILKRSDIGAHFEKFAFCQQYKELGTSRSFEFCTKQFLET